MGKVTIIIENVDIPTTILEQQVHRGLNPLISYLELQNNGLEFNDVFVVPGDDE